MHCSETVPIIDVTAIVSIIVILHGFSTSKREAPVSGRGPTVWDTIRGAARHPLEFQPFFWHLQRIPFS